MDSRPWLFSQLNASSSQLDDNGVPKVGMEFDTDENAWEFWIKYGARFGFDVRKQWSNKDKKDGRVSSARFVCNKEGIRKKDKRDHLTKHSRAETRSNCPARMRIIYVKETEKYKLHDFVHEHNHPLHLAETIHMMSSQRKIPEVQANEIDMASESGIQSKAAYELMSRHCGGRANVGYTLVDQKNYLRMQLDNEEQITNIFWADAKMLIDYAYFGDVVIFDTTYRTNKEFRPFGVFVGLNHHRQIVIFGAALLYDETIESFEWLFRTFLEAHKEKKPKCIFTDQDRAMAHALLSVMPETYHGLCTWHIMQNAIKNLGNLLKDGSHMLKDFKACIYQYGDEETFQIAWKQMMSSYKVEENSWLNSIYKVREKWAKCYMKNVYTLGVRSTQLSESLNGDLKDYLKSDMNIMQFFRHFERVIDNKRYNELKAEFDSRQKLPKLRMTKSPLLLQAGKIYTPTIFDLFHDEYDWSLAAYIKDRKENQQMNEYMVAIFNHDHEEYKVLGNASERIVSCSCKKFENFGILCCHTLKVLDVMYIKLIPDQNIVKRWTREAKSENVEDGNGRVIHGDLNVDNARRYRFLCSRLVKLASRASENEEAYLLLDKAIDELTNKIATLCTSRYTFDEDVQPTCSSLASNEKSTELHNLSQKVKGLKKKTGQKGRKWLKSWVEKQKRKNTKVVRVENSESNLQEGFVETNSAGIINNNQVETNSNTSNQEFNKAMDKEATPNHMQFLQSSGSLIRRNVSERLSWQSGQN